MAPRRNIRQIDVEPVEKVAEAGDASPPKRRKLLKNNSEKVEEKLPMRLPRAAKTNNKVLEQRQPTTVDQEFDKKPSKTKSKTVSKKVTAADEKIVKGKATAKKGKNVEAVVAGSDEPANVVEKSTAVVKKARAKAPAKKAGTENVEREEKPKRRLKKNAEVSDKNVEEPAPKESKAKSRTGKKNVAEQEVVVEVMPAKKRTYARKKAIAEPEEQGNVDKTEETAKTNGKKAKAPATKKVRGTTKVAEDENNAEEVETVAAAKATTKGRQKKGGKESAAATVAVKKALRVKKDATNVIEKTSNAGTPSDSNNAQKQSNVDAIQISTNEHSKEEDDEEEEEEEEVMEGEDDVDDEEEVEEDEEEEGSESIKSDKNYKLVYEENDVNNDRDSASAD